MIWPPGAIRADAGLDPVDRQCDTGPTSGRPVDLVRADRSIVPERTLTPASPRRGGPMHLALAALRLRGAFVLGLILGASAVRVVGEISLDPVGMLVPVIIYAVVGSGILVVAPPRFGVFLLLGWAVPWLLVGLVVATDEFWVPFAA